MNTGSSSLKEIEKQFEVKTVTPYDKTTIESTIIREKEDIMEKINPIVKQPGQLKDSDSSSADFYTPKSTPSSRGQAPKGRSFMPKR